MKPLLLVAAIGCSDPVVEVPSPTPPPSWGTPLTGGTMLVTRDGGRAVIADPDRDRIVTVDLATRSVIADIALVAGEEPGRLVEDGAGRIHVALRRGGSLLTLPDASSSDGLVRRPACTEPRGLAYEAAGDRLHVACASGELVTFPAAGGDATRRLRLDRDLRDVIVAGTQLRVTRFRAAEVLTLDAQGAIVERVVPPIVRRSAGGIFPGPGSGSGDGLVEAVPAVAWRTIPLRDGRLVVAHQRQIKGQLRMEQNGYGGNCSNNSGPIESAIAVVPTTGAPIAVAPFLRGALPVDIAARDSDGTIAVLAAGAERVVIAQASSLAVPDQDKCPDGITRGFDDKLGIPSSVAFAADGSLLVFYPEVPALAIHAPALDVSTPATIALPGGLGYDAGRALFHTQTRLTIACASCHPEARDDGLVWDFGAFGKRRTQSLAGGILRRAPYHWSADMHDLDQLMNDVFANRMGGGPISQSARISLGPWLDRLAPPAGVPAIDPAAAARGKDLFESAATQCTTCHSGELLTNNQIVNVNTGGSFKVPSLLGVGARAPFMHDGCAPTLGARFGSCGGGDLHGRTSTLTPAQLADLVAYLETL